MAASGMIQDFKAQLMADKKKTAALGILSCVLLAVVGRALWPAGSEPPLVPSGAVAGPLPISGPGPVTPRPESLGMAPAVSAPPRSPSSPMDESSRRVVFIDNLPRELARDVFNPSSWSLFPTASVARDRHGTSQPAEAFWESLMRAASEYRS